MRRATSPPPSPPSPTTSSGSSPTATRLAGTYVGPQAVLEGVFMRLGEIGDHFAVVPEQFVADGDTVVALGHLSWKHKDTGAPASVKMAHVWTFRDGKAATFQQHTDTVRVRELSSSHLTFDATVPTSARTTASGLCARSQPARTSRSLRYLIGHDCAVAHRPTFSW